MPVYTVRNESANANDYSSDAVSLVEAAINQVLTEAPNIRDFADKLNSDARGLIDNLTSGIRQQADRTQAGINVIRNKGPKTPTGVQKQRDKAQAKKKEEAAKKDAEKRESHAEQDIIYLNNKINRGEKLTPRQMQRLRTYDAQKRGGKNPSWIEAWD